MNRKIRQYTEADLKHVLAVWENASQVAHPFFTPAFIAIERRNITDVYMPRSETWIMEQGETVVGFISMLDNEVGGLFVDPAFHGIGIGTALMDYVRQLHDTLKLDVFEANTIGRRFYEKYGFTQVSQSLFEELNQVILHLELHSDG